MPAERVFAVGCGATMSSISEGVSTWKTNSYPVLINIGGFYLQVHPVFNLQGPLRV